MFTPRPSRQRRFAHTRSILCLGAALVGGVLLSTSARAETPAPAAAAPELSNAVSEAIATIRPMLEADDPKTYPELLRKLDEIIAKQKPQGYDLAYINQLKVRVLIGSGQGAKAVEPLESILAGNYFPKDAQMGMVLILSQLYMQEAGSTNNTKLQEQRLKQARAQLETWFAGTPEPLLGASNMSMYCDAASLYANCLFFNKDYKKAYETAKNLVRLSIAPNDQAWVLLFAAQQEAGLNAEAAETFELFIRKFPDRKDFWMQLTQAYLSSDQPLRAILTYQRAQEHGFMNSPSDYMNVFGLYYRLEEYSRASELLESWIKTGKVEDSEDNWELVSVCYANLRRDDAVRKVLNESRKRFKTGNLDFQYAQYLWYDGKYKDGLQAATDAWKKGGLKKAGKAALFLATANFEQRNYDLALDFFDKAQKSGDCDKTELDRVARILHEAIEARNAGTNSATPKS
jgi:tetratricopeptide (TPR) repeat protein